MRAGRINWYNGATNFFNNEGRLLANASVGEVSVSVPFNSSGQIDVDQGTLRFLAQYQHQDGTLHLNGTSVSLSSELVVHQGEITGTGTIVGDIRSSGTVRPGGSGNTGELIVAGNYVQEAAGALQMEIGGLQSVADFDRLTVSGTASLNGTLSVGLLNGFVPAHDEQAEVISATTVMGSFVSTLGNPVAPDTYLEPVLQTMHVVLISHPAPPLPKLFLSGPSSVSETGDPVQWTVTRDDFGFPGAVDVAITVSGADDEVTAPVIVTIPAGEASASFDASPVHDGLIDGTQVAVITVAADGFESDSADLIVTDVDYSDLRILNVQGPATAEPGGQISVSWSTGNLGNAATAGTWKERVYLRSAANGLLYFLGEVTASSPIAHNGAVQRQATFDVPVRGIGSNMSVYIEITQLSFPSLKQSGSSSSSVFFPLRLFLTLPNNQSVALPEGTSGSIDVTASGEINSANIVRVTLTSGNTDLVLDSQTIELGHNPNAPHQVRVGFDILKDLIAEGDETAVLTATADGYESAMLHLTILDNAPPVLRTSTQADRLDENTVYDHAVVAEFFVDDDAYHGTYEFVLTGRDAGRFDVQRQGDHYELRLNGTFQFDAEVDAALSVSVSVRDLNLDSVQTFGQLNYVFPIGDLPEPDLLVSRAELSDGPVIADPATVTVTWDVRNNGHDPVDGWSDRIELINEKNQVRVSISVPHTETLAGGETQTFSRQLLLPPTTSGRFHAVVTTDPDDVIEEFTLDNNNVLTSTGTVDVMPRPFADLVIDDFSSGSPTAVQGQSVSLSWIVANHGIGITDTANWVDQVFIATDSQRSDLRSLGSFSHNGVLSPGAAYQRNAAVGVPTDLVPGNYFLFLRTGGPFEFLYTDNWSAGIPVQITDAVRPDLVVTQISNPSTGAEGTTIDVTWTVLNQGTVTTDAVWTDQVLLRREGESSVTVLGSFTVVESIDAGRSLTRTESVRLPSGIQGSYEIVVSANSGSRLFEERTDNNQRTSLTPLQISPQARPDLRIDTNTIVVPAAADAGGTFSVEFDVLNLGTAATAPGALWFDDVYLSLDDKVTGDDLRLGRLSNIAALAPGQSYHQVTGSVEVPILYRGDVFVLFTTDADNRVSEWPNETNNTTIRPIHINPFPL
ncbi:MAG: hypothetical protein KDA89_07850, partial [Planctomycetaceae bacterium]|nr:hypothetical protein [Planctomycetaceae bacterium]